MGLGHMRRNMLIAESLTGGGDGTRVLLLSGSHVLNRFPIPDGVDAVTLPAFRKTSEGDYEPRSLGIERAHLRSLRSKTLRAALLAFRPHVLLVDKRPLGVLGELEASLRSLRRAGGTRIALGLRDILDDPKAVREDWRRYSSESAIDRYYDQVWVYGDPRVYDGPREYGFSPKTMRKVRFTGYLDAAGRIDRESAAGLDLPDGPMVLCQVGGGQDGEGLAGAFSEASLPCGTQGLILTGPFMPPEAVRRIEDRASRRGDLQVLGFTDRPGGLLERASRVVSMGGYNTLAESIALRKPTLVVPRIRPRTEQLIRADRFAAFGLVDVLHPELMSPAAISEWVRRDTPATGDAPVAVDFGGLTRLPGLIASLLADPEGSHARGLRPPEPGDDSLMASTSTVRTPARASTGGVPS